MSSDNASRTQAALGLVNDIYTAFHFEALHTAAEAEQARYGIGLDIGGAVQTWLDAHTDLAEKISQALETMSIPAGGPNEAGLYCIGDVDIALEDENGIFTMEQIEQSVEAAIRTVVEDQAWESEQALAAREEHLRDSREAQERDDMVLGNDW
ncbi:MAG TPA: hypothetical protein VF867_03950 [Arthrobacter sp.]